MALAHGRQKGGRGLARSLTIKSYVVFWAGSMLLALLTLTAGWLITAQKMTRIEGRVLTELKELDTGRLFEIAIYTEQREHLLWRATASEAHKANCEAQLAEAEKVLPKLKGYAMSAEEGRLVDTIAARFQILKERSMGGQTGPPGTQASAAGDLLAAVDDHEAVNRAEAAEATASARRLQTSLTRWFVAVIGAAIVLLALGASALISRVVRPTFALAGVARKFGEGDFTARPAHMRDDEMGHLARTFSNMADEIEQREEARLRFVALVAHDLRNPIVGISLAARRATERGKLEDAEAQRWLRMIAAEAERLDRIAKELTDNVQVAAGKLSLHMKETDLSELVGDVAREVGATAESHKIAYDGPPNCPIWGDPDRLERVILNLVSNAFKYSPTGSTVSLSIQLKESHAVLAVRDHGPGIPKGDLDVIFQPFGRGRQAPQLARGTGLGLFVVKQIVEGHNGTIEIESEVGAGTTVTIELPLRQS